MTDKPLSPSEAFLARRSAAGTPAAAGSTRKQAKIGRVSTGGVAGTEAGAQHVDMYRKLLLRRRMMPFCSPGPIYVPFIGEGDIAVELYNRRRIVGADLEPERVEVAQRRLDDAVVVAGNCDGWPIDPELTAATEFVAADFDSYSYPYESMRAFFANARTADHLVVFFTDAMRMAILRSTAKRWHHPAGHMVDKGDTNSKRSQWTRYWRGILLPWFREEAAPAAGYMVTTTTYYTRGAGLLYWGAVLDRR